MGLLQGAVAALGLGIWTSLQPCPMATNIAAIAYIGRRVDRPGLVLLAGLLYALGRTIAYVALAVLLLGGIVSAWQLSGFLERHVFKILGPLLILVAMVLLELVGFRLPAAGIGGKLQPRVDAWGLWGALPLGIVLALAFCPVSAASFFVSLLAMLAASNSPVVLPSIYGIGTALPVILFATLIAVGASSMGQVFHRLAQVEWWVRRITAVVLIALGVHFSLKYDFGVSPFWDPWLEHLFEGWSVLVRPLHGG